MQSSGPRNNLDTLASSSLRDQHSEPGPNDPSHVPPICSTRQVKSSILSSKLVMENNSDTKNGSGCCCRIIPAPEIAQNPQSQSQQLLHTLNKVEQAEIEVEEKIVVGDLEIPHSIRTGEENCQSRLLIPLEIQTEPLTMKGTCCGNTEPAELQTDLERAPVSSADMDFCGCGGSNSCLKFFTNFSLDRWYCKCFSDPYCG